MPQAALVAKRIPVDLAAEFGAAVARAGVTRSDVLRIAIQAFVDAEKRLKARRTRVQSRPSQKPARSLEDRMSNPHSNPPIKVDPDVWARLESTGRVMLGAYFEDVPIDGDGFDADTTPAEKLLACDEFDSLLVAGRPTDEQREAIATRHAQRTNDERRRFRTQAHYATHDGRRRAAVKVVACRGRRRPSARRREHRSHRSVRRPAAKRGDPEPGSALYAALIDAGGEDFLEVTRAGFLVLKGWSAEKWQGELSAALDRGIVDPFVGADEALWLRVVGVPPLRRTRLGFRAFLFDLLI